MVQLSALLYALTAASGISASPLDQARRALAGRQSSSNQPNAVQNWANDYATETFTTGANGLFTVNWNNGPGGNFVVGRGYQPASDRVVGYSGNFKTTGAAYLALYGWTDNPLVEYYVIEAMGNHNPSDNRSSTQYGCHQSDGGTYEIWQKERVNAPSIKGDHTNFQQYWSVRTSMHVGGNITTGNHFRAWAAAGLKLGTQLYMDVVIEGQGGGGNATITVGTAPKTQVPNTPTPTRRTEKAPGTCPRSMTSSSIKTSSTAKTTTTKASSAAPSLPTSSASGPTAVGPETGSSQIPSTAPASTPVSSTPAPTSSIST